MADTGIEALRAIAERLEDVMFSPDVHTVGLRIRPDRLVIQMTAIAADGELVWQDRDIPWRDFEGMTDPTKTIGGAVDDCKLELTRAVKAANEGIV